MALVVFRTYATGRDTVVACQAVNMRSLQRFHVAVFREATTINQRNLLPRLAVGGAIFYAAKKTQYLCHIDITRDLTKAMVSMNDVAFLPFFLYRAFLYATYEKGEEKKEECSSVRVHRLA